MTWDAESLLGALEGAGTEGLTHEQAEHALGLDSERGPHERGLVDEALRVLRGRGHTIGEPEHGVYMLVHARRAA